MVAEQGRAIAGLRTPWLRTGAQCACLLMFITHHTLSRRCHEVAPPTCCHVTRCSVTPFVSHYITEQPLSCYQGRDNLDTRTLPPLRHKECKGWRTKRSSDYVKLSTVCCWLRPGVLHSLIHLGWISGCWEKRSKGPQKRTTKTSKDLKKSVQKHENSIKY